MNQNTHTEPLSPGVSDFVETLDIDAHEYFEVDHLPLNTKETTYVRNKMRTNDIAS